MKTTRIAIWGLLLALLAFLPVTAAGLKVNSAEIRGSKIMVVFSEAVAAASLTESSIYVLDESGRLARALHLSEEGRRLMIRLQPRHRFTLFRPLVLVMTPDVKARSGGALQRGFVKAFNLVELAAGRKRPMFNRRRVVVSEDPCIELEVLDLRVFWHKDRFRGKLHELDDDDERRNWREMEKGWDEEHEEKEHRHGKFDSLEHSRLHPPVLSVSGVENGQTVEAGARAVVTANDVDNDLRWLQSLLDFREYASGASIEVAGQRWLFALAVDAWHLFDYKLLRFIVETSAPEFVSLNPDADFTSRDPNLVIQGEVANATRVTINDAEVPLSDGKFEERYTLVPGANPFTVVASNGAGKSVSRSFVATYAADGEPPRITIAAPLNGSFFNIGSTLVAGTVADQSAVTGVTVNGLPAVLSGQAFTLAALMLSEGANAIVVQAVDEYGNTGTAQVTVTLDTVAPKVSVVAPSAGALVCQATLNVSGTIEDANPAAVSISGKAGQTAGSGFYFEGQPLSEGENTLLIEAVDRAGNKGQQSLTVVLDTQPPQLTVSAPADGAMLAVASVAVSGTVSDLHEPGVEVNGIPAVISGSGYSAPAPLGQGVNQISVVAKDRAGNRAARGIVVTVDTLAPQVSVMAPAAGALLNARAVDVTGVVIDPHVAAVLVNGRPAALTGSAFTLASLPLQEGANTIEIVASDLAGNSRSLSVPVVVDTEAPALKTVTPAAGTKGVDVGAAVEAEFSEAVDPASLSDATFSLGRAGGSMIAGVLAQDGAKVRLTPVAPLPDSAELTVRIEGVRDAAGNVMAAPYSGSFFTVDLTPPLPPQLQPLAESTSLSQVTVSGSSEPGASITINGGATIATVTADNGGVFSAAVTLNADRLNQLMVYAGDAAGNLSLPAQAVIYQKSGEFNVLDAVFAGNVLTVSFSAAVDPATLTTDAFRVSSLQGVEAGALSASGNSVVFQPGADLSSAAFLLEVSTHVADDAGNKLVAPFARMFNQQGAQTIVQGEVYDDATGLPLSGAQVKLIDVNGSAPAAPVPTAVTTREGRFALLLPADKCTLRVFKEGYSHSDRVVQTLSGFSSTVFDSRLSPLPGAEQVLLPEGCAIAADVGGATVSLILPPGAVGEEKKIRVGRVSAQALQGRLPGGWSPLVAFDLWPCGIHFASPATLVLPLAGAASLPAGANLALAHWDAGTFRWIVDAVLPEGGALESVEVAVDGSGQYAVVVPDTAPAAPAAVVIGSALPAVEAGSIPGAVPAQLDFAPKAIYPGGTATGSLSIVPPAPVASGVAVQARVNERYELISGTTAAYSPYTADLTAYSYGGSQLRVDFNLSPNQEIVVGDLKLGRLETDLVRYAAGSLGVVIGSDGGSVSGEGGVEAAIEAGALDQPLAVTLKKTAAADLPLGVPAGFRFLGAMEFSISGGTLKKSAVLSLELDAAVLADLPSDAQLVACRLAKVGDLFACVASQTAFIEGSRVKSHADLQAPHPFSGVRQGGTYLFLQAQAPAGYFKGVVTDRGAPCADAVVTVSGHDLISLPQASGAYAQISFLGGQSLQARQRLTDDLGAASGALSAAGEVQARDIAILPTGPTVLSVSPANQAVTVPLDSKVEVLFSEPVRATAFNGNNFYVTAGVTKLAGTYQLSSDARQGQFVPAQPLPSDAVIAVTVSAGIQDIHGNPMAQPFQSAFRTKDVAPPAFDVSRIRKLIPENGLCAIQGGAGAIEPGALVIVINDRTGEAVTASGLSDGSFSLNIAATFADTLLVTVKDAAGNEIAVDPGPFTSPDGKAAVIGVEAAEFVSSEGLGLAFAAGTFDEPALVRVETEKNAQNLAVPPSDFSRLQAMRIDFNGAVPAKTYRVSIPAPAGLPAEASFFAAHEVTAFGEKKLMIVDTCALKDGRLTVNSPPWPGIMKTGTAVLSILATTMSWSLVTGYSPSASAMVAAMDLAYICDGWSTPTFVFPCRAGSDFTLIVRDLDTGETLFAADKTSSSVPGQVYELTENLSADHECAKLLSVSGLDVSSFQWTGGTVAAGKVAVQAVGSGACAIAGAPGAAAANGTIRVKVFHFDAQAGRESVANYEGGAREDGSFQMDGIAAVVGDRMMLGVEKDGVALDREFVFEFSEGLKDIDLSSCFHLRDVGTGKEIPCAVALAANQSAVTVTPRQSLVEDTRYSLAVKDLLDRSQNALQVTVDFRTRKTVALDLEDTGGVFESVLYGRYLILAAGDNGLKIVDAANPGNLTPVGVYSAFSGVRSVALYTAPDNKTYALMAGGGSQTQGYLKWIDISDPAQPFQVRSQIVSGMVGGGTAFGLASGTPRRVKVAGDYAFVAVNGSGLIIVDLSQMTAGSNQDCIVGRFEEEWAADVEVFVDETLNADNSVSRKVRAMILIDYSGVKLLDVTTPAQIKVDASFELPVRKHVQGLELALRYGYLDKDGDGRVGEYEEKGKDVDGDKRFGEDETGDFAFFTLPSSRELYILDISRRSYLEKVGAVVFSDAGGLGDICFSQTGGKLYVCDLTQGVYLVDMKDPLGFDRDNNLDGIDDRIVAAIATTGSARFGLVVDEKNQLLYVGDLTRGIQSQKMANPRVRIVVRDDEGKFVEPELLQPWDLEKPADYGAGYPQSRDIYVTAYLPQAAAAPGALVQAELWSLNAAGASLVPWQQGGEAAPTMLAGGKLPLSMFNAAARPDDWDYGLFASQAVRLTVDPRDASGELKLLSGALVQAGLAADLRSVLTYLDENDLRESFVSVDAVCAELTDSEEPEPANNPSTGSGETSFAGPGLMDVPACSGAYLHSGEFFIDETDLRIPGRGFDFEFTRRYESRSVYSGPLGWNWDHTYNRRLQELPGGDILYFDGRGRRERYKAKKSGDIVIGYEAPVGSFTELKKRQDGTFTLVHADRSIEIYDPLGRLSRLQDRNANKMEFYYDFGGRLSAVQETMGRLILFEYYPETMLDGQTLDAKSGRLHTVSDFAGRTVTYEYDDFGDLVKAILAERSKEYAYSTAAYPNDLKQGHNLLSVTDPNGQKYLQLTYSDDKLTSEKIGNSTVTVSSGVSASTTDGNGHARSYTHNDAGNPLTVSEGGVTTTFAYNGDGLVTSVTNPMGNKKEFVYDTANAERRAQSNLLQVKETPDARGGSVLTTTYTYENNTNQVVSMTDPRGSRTTYDRQNIAGNLDAIIAPLNAAYAYTYDKYGQVTQMTDPQGAVTSYAYYAEATPTGSGNLSESGRMLDAATGGYLREVVVDKAGDQLAQSFAYDSAGNVTSRIDGEGMPVEMAVDRYNQVQSVSRGAGDAVLATFYAHDANGNVTGRSERGVTETYAYNTVNRPLNMTRTGGALTQQFIYAYDNNFNLKTITYPKGNQDTFTYDSRNLLTGRIIGGITTLGYAYDGNGNPTHFTDGESHVWRIVYDGHDRVIGKSDPLQNSISYTLDNNANLTGVNGPENLQVSNQFDELNRMAGSTFAGSITRAFQYDPAGNMTKYTNPNNHAWNYTPGGSGLIKAVNDPLGNAIGYGYDKRALPVSVSESEGGGRSLSHAISYNALGNIRSTDDSLQRKWQTHYDMANQLPHDRFDPENGAVGFDYDGLNRFSKETRYINYSGGMVPADSHYEYDLNSNLVAVKDANGNRTAYQYDDKDRLVAVTYPDSRSESYAYDKNDRLLSLTDANGTVVSNTYDAAGRLTARTIAPASGISGPLHESFAYDGLGRLVRAENENTVTILAYDNAGRLVRETQQTRDGATIVGAYEVSSGFDNNGNKTSLTYPSGKALSITPDALDRIASIQSGGNTIAGYTYEGQDKVTGKTLGNAIRLSAQYDDGKRPTSFKYANALTSKDVIDQAMSWNKVDLKTNETRTDAVDQSKNYEYDSAYRLRKSVASQNETAYEIDGADNIKQVSEIKDGITQAIDHTVNNRNQVITLGNKTLTYDNNGNLVQMSGGGSTTNYIYDYRNQLVKVTTGSTQVEFTYDALGRRVQKKLTSGGGSTTVKYVFDGQQVIEERDGANTLKARYVYGNNIDEPVEIERAGAGGMVSYLPMQDTNGNIIGLADSTGKLIEKTNYSSYGQPTFIYDHVAPQVDQVRVASDKINVRFSEPVDQTSAKSAIKIKQGTNDLAGAITFAEDDKLAVFTPGAALPNAALTITITTDLEDENNNKLAAEFSQDFTYAGSDLIVYDRVAPEVERITLLSGKLYVTFSEDLDPAAIANAIGLTYATGTINGTSTLDNSKTIIFTPSSSLTNSTEYTVTVKATVKDLSGKALSVFSAKFIYSDSDLLIFKKLDPTEHTESFVKNTSLFQGREFDPETGLYYFRARYLQPELGRFLQGDPKGYVDSMNPYQSFGNNPVNFSDPMGEAVKPGILPEVAESAYQQFIASGDSPDEALNKLVHYGYIDDEPLYKFALAFSSKTNQYSEALSNSAENVVDTIGITKGFREQIGRLAKGEFKEFWKQGLANLENMSKDPFFGVQLALGISGGIKTGGYGVYPIKTFRGIRWRMEGKKGFVKAPIKGKTVFGHYSPEKGKGYIDLAKTSDATYLNAPRKVYERLGKLGFWEKINKPFIDEAIRRGDELIFSSPLENIYSLFAKELKYILKTRKYKNVKFDYK